MNKRTIKMSAAVAAAPLTVFLCAVILLGASASGAFAASSFTVQTDKSSYQTGDTIKVTGNVGTVQAGQPILIQIYNEKNSPAFIDQTMPGSDGSYSTTAKASGTYYTGSGTYTVKATYAGQTQTATFTFTASSPGQLTAKVTAKTADGKTFEVMSTSATSKVTAVTINENKSSITATFDKPGDVQLMLPNLLISGISAVSAGGQQVPYTTQSHNADTTTIRFTMPNGSTSVDIMGAVVAPEFGVIAAIILATAIVGVVLATRFSTKINFNSMFKGL